MVKVIKNESQYEKALGRVYKLMQKNIAPDSKESGELEVFAFLLTL
jgi:HTH-type transcriptional regulator/antitoxin HigA